ncbi:MAG: glycosyltransferase family 4 protein [Methanomethylovorans sp.]|jgi:glycosyltransferase involved in cell wall biosynthesis|nr:glycosyltransferase family 4 protein [Methanomethylovorans sp.]
MKICFIADATSIHTIRWVEFFLKKGHEIHLITYEPPEIPVEGVNIYVVDSVFNNLYLAFPFRHIKIMRIIKQIKPDIVHAHFITKFGFHGALLDFHPFVISAWGSDVLVLPQTSKLLFYFTKFSLNRADLIHAVSEYMAEEITSSFCLSKHNIKVIPFGINSKQFNPDVKAIQTRKILAEENDPIVISVRNFEPIYNIECLINAIPLVLAKIPNTKFLLLGKGTLRNRLQEMTENLGVSGNVKILGFVSHSELQKYFSCANVYVSTSLSDSLGVSNLEAMACGLPAILTDISINKEFIKKGLNFHLFPPGNSRVLAEKIVELIQQNDRTNYIKNYELISTQYDWEENMNKMDSLYFKIVNCRKNPLDLKG